MYHVCNVFFPQKYHTLVIQILVKTEPSVKNSKVGNTIVSARQVPAVNTVKVRNRSRDVRFTSLYVRKVMKIKYAISEFQKLSLKKRGYSETCIKRTPSANAVVPT